MFLLRCPCGAVGLVSVAHGVQRGHGMTARDRYQNTSVLLIRSTCAVRTFQLSTPLLLVQLLLLCGCIIAVTFFSIEFCACRNFSRAWKRSIYAITRFKGVARSATIDHCNGGSPLRRSRDPTPNPRLVRGGGALEVPPEAEQKKW